MTQTQEAVMKAVMDNRGFYIPPYKIEVISELAGKVVKLLMANGRITLTKTDMETALAVAQRIINLGGADDLCALQK